ncbi:hypothetical protein [Clostridium thermosuccinogenes]|jgi:hypothetical protein|uniref:hypothetical protein n=1 Tax=Clostridium thermosuccinogenes TaxID=84032 RepID=UPI000CCBFE9F|nr:hypothetical protein [Pseudoclostridium thermosuccinogenes]PNT90891.1 hypothetical protein CDQ83_13700 [Pseudoclostridium thermosuccinogenes]
MKFYAITKNGVVSGKSLKQLNEKLNAALEISELKPCGSDLVVKLTEEDLDFIQDKKKMAAIPVSNLYKSDNTTKYIMIGMLFLQFILLIKK